jgi:hypothetical protein
MDHHQYEPDMDSNRAALIRVRDLPPNPSLYFRRDERTAGTCQPLSRVAALLIAISELHAHQGCDPRIVSDSLPCVAVAGWLAIELDALARALVQLEGMGLIVRGPSSDLRLIDRAAHHQKVCNCRRKARATKQVCSRSSDTPARAVFHLSCCAAKLRARLSRRAHGVASWIWKECGQVTLIA